MTWFCLPLVTAFGRCSALARSLFLTIWQQQVDPSWADYKNPWQTKIRFPIETKPKNHWKLACVNGVGAWFEHQIELHSSDIRKRSIFHFLSKKKTKSFLKYDCNMEVFGCFKGEKLQSLTGVDVPNGWFYPVIREDRTGSADVGTRLASKGFGSDSRKRTKAKRNYMERSLHLEKKTINRKSNWWDPANSFRLIAVSFVSNDVIMIKTDLFVT